MSEGQEPTSNPASEQPDAAAAQPMSARVDDAEALRKEIAALRRENAKYRTRNDEETQAKLREQGDFKALYEKVQPDLEKARRYDAFVEREQHRVEQQKAVLSPSQQKAIDKAASLEDKLELLQDFIAERSVQAQKSPPSAPPTGGAPAASQMIDIYSLSPQEYDEMKRRDPKAFAAALAASAGPRSVASSLAERLSAAVSRKT